MRSIHPMKLLGILAETGAVHHTQFRRLEDELGLHISKIALRALRRRGWLSDCIHFAWVLTDEGLTAAELFKATERRTQ